MAKPWHKDFNPLTESFSTFPVWVRLLNLPLHLWTDSILVEVGSSLGVVSLIDNDSSNIYRTTYARILVEIDVSKGLPDLISMASSFGSWDILLDYEGIPFHCRKRRMTGHLASGFSASKSRSMKSPSWWKGASDDHYTVKAPTSGDDDALQYILVEASSSPPPLGAAKQSPTVPSPSVVVVLTQALIVAVTNLASGSLGDDPPLAPSLVDPPSQDPTVKSTLASEFSGCSNGPVGSQPLSATGLVGGGKTTDKGISVIPTSFVSVGSSFPSSLVFVPVVASFLDSGISGGVQWQKAVSLVEDGWTVVKGKKGHSSSVSFDMALRSHKKGSKGKA